MNVRTEAIQTPIVHKHDLLYTPNHTWARIINDKTVRVGLSKYACKNLEKFSGGKFLLFHYFENTILRAEVKCGEFFGVVETISPIIFDLTLPLSGRIKKVNRIVLDNPYILKNNPEETWIIEVEPTHLEEEICLLLTISQYKKNCESGGACIKWKLLYV